MTKLLCASNETNCKHICDFNVQQTLKPGVMKDFL